MKAGGTLFGRTALVIALVSVAFQMFTVAVIFSLALVPLGRHATRDFAGLLVDTAAAWHAAPADERPWLQERIAVEHRIRVQDPPRPVEGFVRVLPYFHLLETALGARTGDAVSLSASLADDGELWYWADIPVESGTVRVGFPASRVNMQPWLAMLLILGGGTLVTLVTSAWLARWLVAPLRRLASATQRVGQGRRPEPLAETGPVELATVAREFNRMAVQVEELLANRTTLLAGISHDLRTPLARLRLSIGMMLERPERDLIERALRDIDAMNDLIARCLEVSRGFAEPEAAAFDLCELLRELATEFDHTGVELRCHEVPDCRLEVRPLALKRILANLLDNAVRYAAGAPIDIEYRLEGSRVAICVLDRGPGIPETEREAVFQPFYRLEPSRSHRTGGSGLGLAIARQLASANGWSVELSPRPGGGTAACVSVPRAA